LEEFLICKNRRCRFLVSLREDNNLLSRAELMLNVLPEGTAVVIRISRMTSIFEAKATVIYSHPNLGMGILFSKLEPNSREVLEKWVAEQNT
jgi:hypothetical protein